MTHAVSAMRLSNSQIDRIGEKLRRDEIDAQCLRDLEIFRSLFIPAYVAVTRTLTGALEQEISGRPAKSTVSIAEKLRRESVRLSQMQDVAGCRVIVPSVSMQDRLVRNAEVFLGDVAVDDKRDSPTNGYRAVHLIVKQDGRPIEIQVRTRIQHAWADISEKIADAHGQSIKYGRGPEWAIQFLSDLSDETARLEKIRQRRHDVARDKRLKGQSHDAHRAAKRLAQEDRDSVRQIKRLFASIAGR